jgi:hypothetical protein
LCSDSRNVAPHINRYFEPPGVQLPDNSGLCPAGEAEGRKQESEIQRHDSSRRNEWRASHTVHIDSTLLHEFPGISSMYLDIKLHDTK